eukprot:355676-Chlamydomonas_euryale.AAC.5
MLQHEFLKSGNGRAAPRLCRACRAVFHVAGTMAHGAHATGTHGGACMGAHAAGRHGGPCRWDAWGRMPLGRMGTHAAGTHGGACHWDAWGAQMPQGCVASCSMTTAKWMTWMTGQPSCTGAPWPSFTPFAAGVQAQQSYSPMPGRTIARPGRLPVAGAKTPPRREASHAIDGSRAAAQLRVALPALPHIPACPARTRRTVSRCGRTDALLTAAVEHKRTVNSCSQGHRSGTNTQSTAAGHACPHTLPCMFAGLAGAGIGTRGAHAPRTPRGTDRHSCT